MHQCEICGATFLNSDEFLAHIQQHYMKKMDEYAELIKSMMGQSSDSVIAWEERLTERITDKVAEGLQGLVPSVSVASPTPKFSFEAIQLASIAATTGKTADEVCRLVYDIEDWLKRYGLK